MKEELKEVFVLLADGAGTVHSVDDSWGAAVTTRAEAERYIKVGGIGYSHSYVRVRIFESFDEAKKTIYG